MKENKKECIIITTCPFCGHAHEVAVNEDDFWDWDDGKNAQDAFPYLTPDEREMLISGICPKCWDSMFGGEDEDTAEEEEGEECEDFEPDYDECGYNPYMGCYDFDC